MNIIAKIVGFIDDELDGAEEYAECAIKYKTEHPKLAEALHELAEVEMGHVKILHDQVVRLIEEYRRDKGEPPKEMLTIYNYEHNKQVKNSALIKQMIAEFES